MIPVSRNIGAGTTDLSVTDNILNIDTTLGAAIINLPKIATWFDLKNKSGAIYDADGLRYTDVSGTAGTNNITFVAAAGDLINGAANVTVNVNGTSGILTPTLDGDGNDTNAWEYSLVGAQSMNTGGGSFPIKWVAQFNELTAPLYELNLSNLSNDLLGFDLLSANIKSITIPNSINLFDILLYDVTLSQDFSFNALNYANLMEIRLTNVVGVNVSNIENAPNLKIFYMQGDIRNIANDSWAIGDFNSSLKLTSFSSSYNNYLTSIGDIKNLPVFTNFHCDNNGGLVSIGNLNDNPMLDSIYIQNNAVLVSVGSISNNATPSQLYIFQSPLLTTIGSLIGSANLNDIYLIGNALTVTVVSQILIDIDTNGLSNGSLSLDGGTNAGLASLTVAGTTAYNNLISKGWTISMNA